MDFSILPENCIIPNNNSLFYNCFDYRILLSGDNDQSFDLYDSGNYFAFAWGDIFDVSLKGAYSVDRVFETIGPEGIFDVDGDFLFGRIYSNGELIICSSRDGQIPVFYKRSGQELYISTDEHMLYDDFAERDLDMNAVNAFLRYGTLIGNLTYSKKIRYLESGSVLHFKDNGLSIERVYLYTLNPDDRMSDRDLRDEIVSAYTNAIKKRSRFGAEDTVLLLSGGMDSRMTLFCANRLFNGRIHTLSFGQRGSEEVNIARQVAGICGNPFLEMILEPQDFIKKACEYMDYTCGEDVVTESFILDVHNKLLYKQFVDGYLLDVYIGGSFINSDAISSELPLSKYIHNHLGIAKMKGIDEEVLKFITKKSTFSHLKEIGDSDLKNYSSEYDGYPLSHVIQPFVMENRDKRKVYRRNKALDKHMHYIASTNDIECMKAFSKIPPVKRLGGKFQQTIFCEKAIEYAAISYNNTTLPLLAHNDLWQTGVLREEEREKDYERIMASWNPSHDAKIYYPHYYSDFNGYSRYDELWIDFMQNSLLADDAIITADFFEKKSLSRLIEDHLSQKRNNRNILMLLISLELFLKNNLN